MDSKNQERIELLDESWFFGNLLERKPRMLRCYSDPCPSSSSNDDLDHDHEGKSMEETFSSINRIPLGKRPMTLMKTPSMPPTTVSLNQQSDPNPNPRIQRAPSLPCFAEKEETLDEESDFLMGKLIRQASLNQSKVLIRQASLIHQSNLLPPRQTAKSVKRSCSISAIPKQNLLKKTEPAESINSNSGCDSGKTKPRYAKNQSKIRKSHSSVDIEEVKGLKNLGHPSEAWLAKSVGPPLESGTKSAEDMKAQIRFWARAVASNVRQEC